MKSKVQGTAQVCAEAIAKAGSVHFNVGAGIVADSRPEAEYEETMAKAGGFIAALGLPVARGSGKQTTA